MRNKSIDVLKLICAFLVVCIHIPPEIGGVQRSTMQDWCTNLLNDFWIFL